MKEARVVMLLRQMLETKFRCLTEKLHGSVFQEGLPDLLVVTPTGDYIFIELKAGGCHDGVGAVEKLQGRQKLVCCRFGMRGARMYIVGASDDTSWWLFDCRQLRDRAPEEYMLEKFSSTEQVANSIVGE